MGMSFPIQDLAMFENKKLGTKDEPTARRNRANEINNGKPPYVKKKQ